MSHFVDLAECLSLSSLPPKEAIVAVVSNDIVVETSLRNVNVI